MLESSLSDPGVDTKYLYLVLLAEITDKPVKILSGINRGDKNENERTHRKIGNRSID